MKTKNYLMSIVCVYMCYLTHGIQAIILSQNNINFATQWGFDMSTPDSAAYAAGLAVVQMFNPGPKGRNTGIYYTFMGAASYLIPVVAAQLTKMSGEENAIYTLMIMLLVFAVLAILSSLYLVKQHTNIFGKSALAKQQ